MIESEAIRRVTKDVNDNRLLIHDIYNYLKSRICENCKWYGAEHEHITHPNYKTCINVDSFTYMNEPHFTDGCNQWKDKTVSTNTKS